MQKENIVMIVDDDPGTRRLLSEILKRSHLVIAEFGAGKEAIKFFETHIEDVALALIDIRLPDIDGFEVLTLMRQLKPEMPAIAISAFYSPADAKSEGFNEFVSKPIALSKMADLVNNIVSSN